METRQRQNEILDLRFAGLTYEQIAVRLHISRQRVHQLIAPPLKIRNIIVKRANGCCQICGLCVNGSGHVHHVSCDGEDYNDVDNLQLLCINCHRNVHLASCSVTYCPVCGKVKSTRATYCSDECRLRAHRIELTCDVCGKHFYRLAHETTDRYKYADTFMRHGYKRTDKVFCSRECQGKWLGRNHGWGRKKTEDVIEIHHKHTPIKVFEEVA